MKTCEFCEYGRDECALLNEPIEYEPSGMTVKENCPVNADLQVSGHKRKMVHGEDKPNMVCTSVYKQKNTESDREV